jgi:hypothetical protein
VATESSWVDVALDVVAVLAMLLGVLVGGYGLLLVPVSLLGGLHVAAIGACLFFSGLFATDWAGDQFDLAPGTRRTVSLAFAVLAVILVVAFLVVNYATFSVGEAVSE